MTISVPKARARRATTLAGALALVLAILMPLGPRASAAGEAIDLMFLVDGSGSISSVDWQTQKDGLSAALQDAAAFPRDGSIAVGVVQWSWQNSSSRTRLEVPLTVIDSQGTADGLVAQIQAIPQIGSLTNPGDGIRRGTNELLAAGEDPGTTDWILCMSTDGTTNSGESLSSATAYAQSSGVDKYSVIGIEDPPFASAATLRNHYSPHTFGGGSVTIARNSLEFANLIIGACLGDPVELRALEVNQAVQDWQNSVSVITGKYTAVRAFVQVPAGEDDQRVVGRLFGRRGGADLPGSPLLAINPGSAVLATEDIESRRAELDDSLNFYLPPSWRSGTVELEFDAAGAPVSCQEPAGADPADNCVVRVTFQDEVEPEVVFVGVRYSSGGTDFEPGIGDLMEQMFRFRSIFPIADIDWSLDTMGNYSSKPALTTVNDDLEVKRFLDVYFCFFCTDNPTANSRYYGVLEGSGGGRARGIPGRVSSGFLAGNDSRGDTGYERNRGPHELAHNLERHHAVDNTLPLNGDGNKVGRCSEVADPAAPGHTPFETVGGNVRPVLGPLSSGADDEIWGLDNRFLFFNTNDLAVVDPRVTFELMSYCSGGPQARWISEFTYNGVMGEFPGTVGTSTGSGDYVLVTGSVDFASDTATLGPTLEFSGDPPAPAAGDYRVELRDGGGAVLAAADFEAIEDDADAPAPETPTGPPIGAILVPLPAPASPVAEIVVLHNGTPIGGATASANAPTVSIVNPAGGETFTDPTVTFDWSGSDADGDDLTYTVLYSADDGDTWDTLAVNTPDTSLTAPRSDLAASATARLQVIVSDAVLTSSATSNQFAVANNAPLAFIDVPGDGGIYSGVQNVDFVGAAFDPDDGLLDGGSLVWTSDLNGFLGTGEELTRNASTLVEGIHEITLTATDGDGITGTDTVTIQVFRVAPPPPPPVIEVDVEVKPGSDPAPVNTTSNGVTPVAILTTDDFDATSVDPATVCFGDDCTEKHGTGHLEDVDGDGDTDLVMHFETQQTGIEPGDTEVCLTGETFDGDDIEGCDEIDAK